MVRLVYFLLVILVLSSCSTSKYTSSSSKSMDIYGAGVIQNPVLVDLDVSNEKVSGNAEGYSTSVNALKQQAISNATKLANCDVLIEPRFETETKGNSTLVTVTGYPARYVNFRPLRPEDVALITTGHERSTMVLEPRQEFREKKRGAAVALTMIGIIAAALLFL